MLHTTHISTLEAASTFAGFTYPRYLSVLDQRPLSRRLADRRQPRCAGAYYTNGEPITRETAKALFFYLDDAGQPGRHWEWADEIDRSIAHRGWYTDPNGDRETIRGLVVYLSHGRCLAGWSMGRGMGSAVETDRIYTDPHEAAHAADEAARIAAEHERDYQGDPQDDSNA